MTTSIALLRAVNVAGHKPVAMEDLRAFFSGLGFADVRTILQSGNVVFEGKTTEAFLEGEASKRLGLTTDFFVRTANEWNAIVGANPFPRQAGSDPARLVVTVLKSEGKSFDWPGPEILRLAGRHAYIYYPNGQGRSKLTNAVLEKRLGTRGTARNWNTVLRLLTAAGISS